jgi:hypothetical protein
MKILDFFLFLWVIFALLDPDPDPQFECGSMRIRIRIRNPEKNLDSYYFVALFDFLSLKNDVNVPSKSNKQKKLCQKLVFCWHHEGQ